MPLSSEAEWYEESVPFRRNEPSSPPKRKTRTKRFSEVWLSIPASPSNVLLLYCCTKETRTSGRALSALF